jgi:molecular chaperone Hsp33
MTQDSITSFIIHEADVRGRVVRLGMVANTILSRYDYPPAMARLLGELLAVAAMLSANLKQEGIFTVQVRGTGLVPLLVVDAAYGGQLRGFAEVSAEADAAIRAMDNPTPAQLFGADAYLAITLDPGAGMQRYQGVVGFEGASVTDALEHYFTHSQQADVLFRLGVEKGEGGWVVGGLMVERLPPEDAATRTDDADLEPWRYASALAATVKPEELIDPLLDAPALLYRLYHEDGVWVQEPHPLQAGCRCSRERIHQLLLSMPITDRADMIVDGHASVHCQFCNTTEQFTPEELGLSVN